MKEKREFNMLENADDRTVELLSGVPVLTDEEKKRMLAMSKKKLNKMNRENNISMHKEGAEVSGVERYNRPKWYTFVSAAACLVLVGGIAGTVFALNRNGKDSTKKGNTAVEVQTTTDAAVTTTDAILTIPVTTAPVTTEPDNFVPELTEEELVAAALGGFGDYFLIEDIANGVGVEVDAADKFTDTRYTDYPDEGDTVYYCRVSDTRFSCIDDVKALMTEYLTDPILTDHTSNVFDTAGSPSVYIERDGKLYLLYGDATVGRTINISSRPVISGYDGTTFYADATADMDGSMYNVKAQFAFVDGKWKVSGFEVGDSNNGTDSDTEAEVPNVDLAMDILEDFTLLDNFRVGMVDINLEEEITNTIVDGNGYEYIYYKVSDDYANENFKNAVEDIKRWVDSVVTGDANENLFKSIYAKTESGKPAMFKEIDGELYYLFGLREAPFRWFGEPQIKNVQNGSFDIVVYCHAAEESNMVKDLIVHVEKDGYGWKISKCEYDESSLRAFTEDMIGEANSID